MSGPAHGGGEGRAGFTLLELLVVVALIGVLAGLLLPVFFRIRETGNATACLSNLRQIGAGLNTYLGDNDLTMPTLLAGRATLSDQGDTIDTVLKNYLRSPQVMVCPSDAKIAQISGTSYYWNVALNGQRLASLSFLKITEEQDKIPVISDKDPVHLYLDNKVNILYADGHAEKYLKFSAP